MEDAFASDIGIDTKHSAIGEEIRDLRHLLKQLEYFQEVLSCWKAFNLPSQNFMECFSDFTIKDGLDYVLKQDTTLPLD